MYTDETVITFGKHKGKKLANVPASWLMWYNEFATNQNPELMAYIKDNLVVIMQEADLEKLKRS